MARLLRLTSPHMMGDDVRALQEALNARMKARNMGSQLGVDGEYGPEAHAAYREVAWALGLEEATIERGATPGAQQIIIDPNLRNAKQRGRATARAKQTGGVNQVLQWCQSKVGMTESPPGSNRGPEIDKWQREFGISGTYWCGAFVGYAVRKIGGVPIGKGVVYTPTILSWAKTRTGGFEGFYSWNKRKKGDLVLMRFPNGNRDPVHHVGIFVGGDETIEGNTSSGNAGSQDNGGGVFKRKRPASMIVGCARPRYPA